MSVSEADAGSGGAGAPPQPNEPNRVRSDLTREYISPAITVEWYAARCIHSAACVKALPKVFDPRRRPWIEIGDADADAVASAVLQCPTGALHFRRDDGGSEETVPSEVTIRAVRDGPYILRGPVRITGPGGEVLREDSRVALCRCGNSRHMPFCDNTHRAIGFRSNDSQDLATAPSP